jgi:CHAT domain-containing protein
MHQDAFGEEKRRLLVQGRDATEELLKVEMPLFRVVHLATHGFFQPEGLPSMWSLALDQTRHRTGGGATEDQQVMRIRESAQHLLGHHPGLLSGLVCAGANQVGSQHQDDGYLTAEEVGWLDLSKVELVVLSACETGLGRARSGEGLIGLRRAFRTAGARTVISSLWSVKDESTSRLMQSFYANLFLRGLGRCEALRSAQLEMLQRNRMQQDAASPGTWGAFVLDGEWR